RRVARAGRRAAVDRRRRHGRAAARDARRARRAGRGRGAAVGAAGVAGGERAAAAARPWVGRVFAAMPEVKETIELPFAHGRLDWSARRGVAATLRGRFDVAYVLPNSLKAALVPWLPRL